MTETRTSYLIGRTDRVLSAALDRELADLGLALNEVTALSVLAERPALSNADLARRSLVTPQAMHKVVRSLESAGLIERVSSPNGGRSLRTTISARGLEALAHADERIALAEAELLAPLDDDERRVFRRLLLRVARLERVTTG